MAKQFIGATFGVTALSAMLLSGCAGSDEPVVHPSVSPAATQRPESVPDDMAALRVNTAGCEGCTINLQSAPEDKLLWESGWQQVISGTQWVLVPDMYLEGLSMQIQSPAVTDQTKPTNVAVLYKGLDPGEAVNPGSIESFQEAYGCWTDASAKAWLAGSITVETTVVEVNDHTRLLAYVGVGMEPFGNAFPTESGVLSSPNGEFLSCT